MRDRILGSFDRTAFYSLWKCTVFGGGGGGKGSKLFCVWEFVT